MEFSCVLAETSNHGIGNKSTLPWKCPEESKYFLKLIQHPRLQNVLIMGRQTWEAHNFGKHNIIIVLSSTPCKGDVITCASISAALEYIREHIFAYGEIWILGGARVYNEAQKMPQCTAMYISKMKQDYECDVFWDGIDRTQWFEDESYRTYNTEFIALKYTRMPSHPEMQYLRLVRQIMRSGETRNDRTGVGTISIFGAQLQFDLRLGFPLLTTKRIDFSLIVKELLWFISGSTDTRELAAQGVHIWDKNTTREFLDERGLYEYEEGQAGPIYGHQWRCADGIDQLKQCIQDIRTNATSRRIIISSWNVKDLPKMVLPPCHTMCQFYVTNKKELSCHMYQRSGDVGLGVPFNIASYALLTHMIAHVCNLTARELVISFGDVHIYQNHIDAMSVQIKRTPLPLTQLKLSEQVGEIDDFKFEDVKLTGYVSYDSIKMKMAV